MSTTNQTDAPVYSTDVDAPRRRLTTETKSAFKTTELIVFLLSVAGVLTEFAIQNRMRIKYLRFHLLLVIRFTEPARVCELQTNQ